MSMRAADAHAAPDEPGEPRLPRCLVVDDSRFDRYGIQRHAAGVEFHEAATVGEAREALVADSFDLILLDRNLPDGDGIALAREIGADARHGTTPRVLISNEASAETAAEARAAGCMDCLDKGAISTGLMADLVRRALARTLADGPADPTALAGFTGAAEDPRTSEPFLRMLQNFGEAFLVERQKPIVEELLAVGSAIERASTTGDLEGIRGTVQRLYDVAERLSRQLDETERSV